jgi:DNA mismatch repair ATPase MutL
MLTIERYATSKIKEEKDLFSINSYGFRGEALATISEVSGFRIQTRTKEAEVA